jgi:hypothetical protein
VGRLRRRGQGKGAEQGLLDRILYGGSEGALSAVELRSQSHNYDLALSLSHSAVLVWVDPGKKGSGDILSSGEPAFPRSLSAIKGISDPAQLGGFQLALIFDRRRLVTIPISGDRLDAAKAETTSNLMVAAAPH